MVEETIIQRAVRKAGGPKKVSEVFGITHQAVCQWVDSLPPQRAIELERLSGVPRHELCPNVFPAPEREGAAA